MARVETPLTASCRPVSGTSLAAYALLRFFGDGWIELKDGAQSVVWVMARSAFTRADQSLVLS